MDYNEKVVDYYERITSVLRMNNLADADDDEYEAAIHALVTVLAVLGGGSSKTNRKYCNDITQHLYTVMSELDSSKTLN
jgi:hypothetical protein